jgi:Brp/Blh family beta-carotene 15,15'-monooxygenase
MVAFFDPGAVGRVAPLFAPWVRGVVGGSYVGITLAYLAYAHQRTGGRAWLLEAGETLLLVAYFAVVPPVVAVGVYFPCWYAARQVARMADAGDADPALGRVVGRVLRGGFLPWVGAIAILVGLAVRVPGPDSATGWVALYSVFVAAIALPHVVVGGWLDRTQGIWSVD